MICASLNTPTLFASVSFLVSRLGGGFFLSFRVIKGGVLYLPKPPLVALDVAHDAGKNEEVRENERVVGNG